SRARRGHVEEAHRLRLAAGAQGVLGRPRYGRRDALAVAQADLDADAHRAIEDDAPPWLALRRAALGHEHHRELEPLGLLHGHHAHDVLVLAEDLRGRGERLLARRLAAQTAHEALTIALPGGIVRLGQRHEGVEVGDALLAVVRRRQDRAQVGGPDQRLERTAGAETIGV